MQERMRPTFRWLVWLSLSLVMWTAAAESTHNHANPAKAASCAICSVAHTATPSASSNDAKPFLIPLGIYPIEKVSAKASQDVLVAGIRGPPSA
jgi:hypothetical protein